MYADAAPAAAPGEAHPAAGATARVTLLGDDAAGLAAVERSVVEALPGAVVEVVPSDVVVRSIVADCVVVDAMVGERTGAEAVRALRAGGFTGAIVLLGDAADAERSAVARRFGAEGPVRRDDPAIGRVALRALEASRALATDGAAGAETVRLWRLAAAGELALGLQHALSNPLTALLAEAQLLQLDLEDGEQRAAAARIVELCRRTILVARQLDDVAPGA